MKNTSICCLLIIIAIAVVFFIGRSAGMAEFCRFGKGSECVFACWCSVGCNRTTGDCLDGGMCQLDDPTEASVYRTGPGCIIGNVALEKPTNQSGQWTNSHSGLAVDGIITDRIRQCSSPDSRVIGQNEAWWYVDLQETFTILGLTIFNRRRRYYERTGDMRLGVGGVVDVSQTTLCKQYVGPVPQGGHATIDCDNPVTGRYVTIIRTGGFEPFSINLCEVMVHGYRPIICSIERCQSCDPVIGCEKCTPGYKYPSCEIECDDRFYGDNCLGVCSDGCMERAGTRKCALSDGRCELGCKDGYWGRMCETRCGDNCLSSAGLPLCISNNGSCAAGCNASYYGHQCELSCSDGCVAADGWNTCHRYTGICLNGCRLPPHGTWYAGGHCNQTTVYVDYPDGSIVEVLNVTSTSVAVQWQRVRSIPSDRTEAFGYLIFAFDEKNNQTLSFYVMHLVDSEVINGTATGLSENTTYEIVVYIYRQSPIGKTEVSRKSSMAVFVTTLDTPDGTATRDPLIGRTSGTDITWPIVGAVIGLVVLAALVAVIIFTFYRLRKASKRNELSDIGNLQGNLEHDDARTDLDTENGNPVIQKEETVSTNLYYDLPATKTLKAGSCIEIDNLELYIASKKYTEDGLKKEFNDIPNGELKLCTIGRKSCNIRMNRYKNMLAYDETRVTLQKEEGLASDYINASYIKGYPSVDKRYVATQGPRPETVNSFWSMVWQLRSDRIVMLTRLVEQSKTKCEQYWPEKVGQTDSHGDIRVTTTACSSYTDSKLIIMMLKNEAESRSVKLLQFLSWPDKQSPEHAFPLLAFRRKLRSFDTESTGPIVVHCSAGVGRTGTFIALDYLLDRIKAEGNVDVVKLVTQLRFERMNMIQTLSQYIFLYDALLEAHQQGETAFPCSMYPEIYKQLVDGNEYSNEVAIEEHYKTLLKLKQCRPSYDECSHALSHENCKKNRDKEIIPANVHRLYLSSRCPGTNDYVNAVLVNNFLSEKAVIVTQLPLPSTVVDFWRLVYENKCHTVLTLQSAHDKDCPNYWSLEKGTGAQFGSLEVVMDNVVEEENGKLEERHFTLTYTSTLKKESASLRHILYKGWEEKQSFPDKKDLLNLLEKLPKIEQQNSNEKLVIQCKDGATRSGVVCAAHYLVEKMKADGEVDVFLAVRAVSLHRYQFVNYMEQYRFLHDIALEYISGNELYENFK